MPTVELFNEYQPLLFGIAYRMLGSVMDAEDVVQDTFLRWQQAPSIENPRAWLTSVVTRSCIDQLRSARVQREAYIGPWLPEPLVIDSSVDPVQQAEPAESLSFAFMLLLERLAPVDRAVFVLRDVFDYSYEQISAIVGKSEASCRQIVHRARERVTRDRTRFVAAPAHAETLTTAFVQGCTSGDLDRLIALLADDATLLSDGGGKVRAARHPILGAQAIARFMLGIIRIAGPEIRVRRVIANGEPAIISYTGTQLLSFMTFQINRDRIQTVYIVVNPDKLAPLHASES